MTATDGSGLRFVRSTVSGWAQYPRAETSLYRPERRPALEALVRHPDGHLIARGLGASYGDASFSSTGGTVLMTRFDRLLAFDSDTGILSCEAGVTIDDLLRVLVPRGFFPPVSPGTRQVTLGGCIACDVHGKNHHRSGSLSAHLLDFHLLTASGALIRCSRTERQDLFWATVGGMGLTGVITELRLRMSRIETPYLAVDYDRAGDLDTALRLFEEDGNYAYSVAWLDCLARGRSLGRGVLMRANPLAAAEATARGLPRSPRREPRSITMPFRLPTALLNPITVGAFNALYYRRFPARARGVPVHYAPYFYPLDRVKKWHRLYGRPGFFQYQCVVPFEGGRETLVRLLETIARHRRASFLAVLKRFGPADPQQLLSFPKPGFTLALDIPRDEARDLPLLQQLDEIVAGQGGRVYLAKDARLAPEQFRVMYPELDRWLAIKREVDPDNRFRSDLADRLGLLA